jgi:predicted nucleotidyltransferase
VQEVILFGSVARGECTDQSDIDVAVVVTEKSPHAREVEAEAGERIMNRHGTLIGCLLYSAEEWQKVKRLPLGQRILTEGVRL